MSLAVVLQVCPWLSLPRSLLGLVGMGEAAVDLFHAFWDGLDELQRAELLAAAMEAGVNLRTYLRGGGGGPGLSRWARLQYHNARMGSKYARHEGWADCRWCCATSQLRDS